MSDRMVFVYDGDCAFCSSCVRFLDRHMTTPARYVPWQRAELESLGLTAAECADSVQWVAPGDPRRSGPDAIAALLRQSRGLWRLAGRVLAWRWVSRLAWPVYRWVARHRHRFPGGTAACAVPPAGEHSA